MNKDSVKAFVDKLRSDKKLVIILVIGILGMLLILFSQTGGEDKKETEVNAAEYYSNEKETAEMLEAMVQTIRGAGKAKVMISYESGEETVYARDTDESTASPDKEDRQEKYIIIDASGGEEGLKLKVISPKVRGVAVVCEGGADPVTREQIITMISALFDIRSNQISVAEMAK